MKRTKVKRLPRNPYAVNAKLKTSTGAMKASKHHKRKQQRLQDKQAIREEI